MRANFYVWLLEQQSRKDPVGDLAREVRQDPGWPKFTNTNDADCHRHLDFHDVKPAVHEALDRAWREYGASYSPEEELRDARQELDQAGIRDEGLMVGTRVVLLAHQRDKAQAEIAAAHALIDRLLATPPGLTLPQRLRLMDKKADEIEEKIRQVAKRVGVSL